MGEILRHSQRKRRETGLSSLNPWRHSLTLPADSALRRQDRRFFETQNRPKRLPDLLVAARVKRRPFGRRYQSLLCYNSVVALTLTKLYTRVNRAADRDTCAVC
jgi:hypothetical protein